jgi:peptide/nickel transport system ATP-binding protein
VLYRGQIMETGPVEAVSQKPRHPYTVALTAAAPVPRPAEQAARRAAREALGVGTAGAAQPSATGCPFVPRCPLSTEICVEQRPPLRLFDGSLTACHHAEQVPAL